MTLRETMQMLLDNGCELKDAEHIQFGIKKYDTPSSVLRLPARAENAMLRKDIRTIGDMIDVFGQEEVRVRGIGAKTIRETKVAIVEWYWSTLDKKGKKEFLQSIFV